MADDSAIQPDATAKAGEQQTQEQIDAQLAADAKAKEEADAEATKKAEEEALKARQRDPRNAMMEEVAARHHQHIAADFAAAEEKTAEELDDEAAEKKRKELEEDAARQAQIDAQTGADTPKVLKPEDFAKFKVVQTIDGETKEVPLTEVVRQGQVAGAADYRLNKATETLDRALAVAKDLEEKARGDKTAGDDKKKASTAEIDVDAKAKEAFDLVLDGKVDEAAKIFAETMAAVGGGRSATPNTDEIVSAVTGRIRLEQQLTTFQKDYADVANDKHLGPMVDREFMDLVPKDANGVALPLPPDEFGKKLREAGDKVRGWAKDKFGAAKTAPVQADTTKTLEEKRAAKENLDQTTGAGAKAPSTNVPSAEPSPQQRSSVIADIAKARGQQV